MYAQQPMMQPLFPHLPSAMQYYPSGDASRAEMEVELGALCAERSDFFEYNNGQWVVPGGGGDYCLESETDCSSSEAELQEIGPPLNPLRDC